MLNFDGVPLSFVPGRNVPNKEPPTNRFVVEKLYRVHRKRMLKMEPIVDCHVEIPDFLTNQNWKQITQQHRRDEITRENEVIYKRIAKAENAESQITKENREHAHHVENELRLMKRLKRMGRIRDILKTQRENEDMLRRIDRARPAYGLKSIKEWYKHHELFKKGRRSDPTAGHLGFRNMKGLWPKPLPEISSPEQSPTKSFVSRGDKDRGNSPPNFSLVSDPLSMTIDGHEEDMSIDSSVLAKINQQASLYGSHSPGMSPANYYKSNTSLADIDEISTSTSGAKSKKSKKKKSEKGKAGKGGASGKMASSRGKGDKSVTMADSNGSRATTSESKRSSSRVGTPGSIRLQSWANSDEALAIRNAAIEVDGYNTLFVREMPVPFADKTSSKKRRTCLVQFLMKKGTADSLLIIVRSSEEPYEESSRKVTPMDKVFQLVSTEGTTSMFSDSSMISDLSGMRDMFIQMFHEVDSDGNGYLTFDEFLTLMERFNMGLDEGELRKILAAADDNGNGVVEADEFYPLILDLVLAYRTFNAAKRIMSKKDAVLEEEANVCIDDEGEKLDEVADSLFVKVQSYDAKKSGFVRHTDLKKALTTMAGPLELTTLDCAIIMRSMPVSGGFSRINYATLPEAVKRAKWTTTKYKLQEDLATPLFTHLLHRCSQMDTETTKDDWDVGLISGKDFLDILKSDDLFSLTTIQSIMLASLVPSLTAQVNYHDILPMISKTIELMLDPTMLKQRADLLHPDLDAGALVSDFASKKEEAENRLQKLFNIGDTNNDAVLSHVEFGYCIRSLGLDFNEDEILALFSQADPNNTGQLTFPQFAKFFEKNLSHLERQVHMKAVYNLLHDSSKTIAAVGGLAQQSSQLKDLEDHLNYVFEAKAKASAEQEMKMKENGETTSSGRAATKLSREEVISVLQTIDVTLSNFQLSSIMSELFHDADGFINVKDATMVSAHLLQVFLAEEEGEKVEKEAERRARDIVTKNQAEIHRIVAYFVNGLKMIDSGHGGTKLSGEEKEAAVENLVRSPHSGLTPTEGNMLMHSIFNHKWYAQAKKTGDYGYDNILKPTHVNDKSKYHQAKTTSIRKMSNVSKYSGGDDSAPHDTLGLGGASTRRNARQSIRRGSKRFHDINGHGHHLRPTAGELTDAVCNAKKHTAMRNIVQTVSAASVSNLLIKSFEHTRELLILQRKHDKMNIYMPVHMVFEILEECLIFRLSRPQLTAMVAFCTCFDRTDSQIDYKAFAQYAGDYIQNFSSARYQYRRSHVMHLISKDFHSTRSSSVGHSTPTITAENMESDVMKDDDTFHTEYEDFALNGVTEKDMDKYLIDEFLMAEDNRGEVSQRDFVNILTKIPNVVLTSKDAVAISAAFPHTDSGMIQWQEFVPWAHSSVSALALEHMIARRLSILDFDEDISDLNGSLEEQGESQKDKGVSSQPSHTPGGAPALESKESKLQKTLQEACDLLRIRMTKEADEELGEDGSTKIHDKILALWPFDDDINLSVSVRRAQSEDREDEDMATVASLDSLGVDQGMNEAESQLFCGDYCLDCLLVQPPKTELGRNSEHKRSGKAKVVQSPGRLTMRKSHTTMNVSDAKALGKQTLRLIVTAVEKSLGLDRDLRVEVSGKFDYQKMEVSETGTPFNITMADTLGMPSMCLIDTDSAIEYAETLGEKLVIHFTAKGAAEPKVVVKTND